jgi:hypothetical protein
LKRFLALSRLWITGLKPGVNEMRDFQTFEAKPYRVWDSRFRQQRPSVVERT